MPDPYWYITNFYCLHNVCWLFFIFKLFIIKVTVKLNSFETFKEMSILSWKTTKPFLLTKSASTFTICRNFISMKKWIYVTKYGWVKNFEINVGNKLTANCLLPFSHYTRPQLEHCGCFCVKDKLSSQIYFLVYKFNLVLLPEQILVNIYCFPPTVVLLKYQDPFIEYAIFKSCLSCSSLLWAQNFSTIQWIVSFNTIPYSSKVCLRIISLSMLFKYWSGKVKCYFNYVSIN